MKKMALIIGTAILLSGSVFAYTTFEFPGWLSLEQKSHDIILVKCAATPDPYTAGKGGAELDMRGLINSELEIISVLKGATNSGSVKLTSEFWPKQGEFYLVFASYHDGFYQAFEPYRIVPLGTHFLTNNLAGKGLDEQIRMLLQMRLNELNRQMAAEQVEKTRLEEALKD